jgi:hypothetical protein
MCAKRTKHANWNEPSGKRVKCFGILFREWLASLQVFVCVRKLAFMHACVCVCVCVCACVRVCVCVLVARAYEHCCALTDYVSFCHFLLYIRLLLKEIGPLQE